MGLDMFLNRKTSISSGLRNHNKRTEETFKELKVHGVDPSVVRTIVEEVGYWRKDNHIHKWFVDNVQDGNDDCGKYWVSEDDLKKLKKTCEEVLKDSSKKEDLLPTQSGFFFGDTNYDQNYFDSLKDTIEVIDRIFENEKEFEKIVDKFQEENKVKKYGDDDSPPMIFREYEYQSSW